MSPLNVRMHKSLLVLFWMPHHLQLSQSTASLPTVKYKPVVLSCKLPKDLCMQKAPGGTYTQVMNDGERGSIDDRSVD